MHLKNFPHQVSGRVLPLIPMSLALLAGQAASGAEEMALINGWQFHQGPVTGKPPLDTRGGGWKQVTLPHDWSIALPRKADAPAEGAGGFFPTGMGCYQTPFRLPAGWAGKTVFVHFEGIARQGDVWLNGQHLGRHVNAYTPVRFDLTPHLDFDGPNILTVVVDNSEEPASRWYTGSGLYRPVWLEAVEAVRVADGGLFAWTESIDGGTARIVVEAEILNAGGQPVEAELAIGISGHGSARLQPPAQAVALPAGATRVLRFELELEGARLWSPGDPHLHELAAALSAGGQVMDRRQTAFGIRTVRLSQEEGLLLNGKPVKLMGCNIHHDYGILGAAVHEAAVLRKVRLIREAGFNAVRTSHNPPSTAFLAACDRMGLLVMDEAYDTWMVAKLKHDYHRHFAEHWQADLTTLVRRDRNHPSVILWSTGNEMYDRRKDYAPALSAEMVALVKRLDPTRPVTAGINGLGDRGQWSDLDPLFATFDLASYNYELKRHADDRARVPGRLICAAETYPADAFASWQIVAKNHYVIGEFIWSGLDYLGEAGIGRAFAAGEKVLQHWEGSHYPWHGAVCGDIDLTGFRKPVSHYRNILWDRGEMLYMAVFEPSPDGGLLQTGYWTPPPLRACWTWPGHEGRDLTVEVYSRHEAVRLYRDEVLIGEAATSEATAFKAVFSVPYQPGQLRAEGITAGEAVQSFTLQTTGKPARLWLTPSQRTHAPGQSALIFLDVQVTDAAFRNHPHAGMPVRYAVSGPAEITAIGSGNLGTTETYLDNPRRVHEGRALLAVRTTGQPGDITVTASAQGLEDASITIAAR